MESPKKSGDSDWGRVAENLYRYRPAGMYYAYFWRGGKQIKKSLKTKDRAYAKRKLSELDNPISIMPCNPPPTLHR